MKRWFSNANEIHCISNEGHVEMSNVRVPEVVATNTKQPPSASAPTNGMKNGGAEKLSCSEDDVLKYFQHKRRTAQIAKLQSKTMDDAWISQQEKQNKLMTSNVESKSMKPNAVAAQAYTSLNKGENVCHKRPEPDALPAIQPANGEITTQKVRHGDNDRKN